jgi:uncharacterized membrane protein (DUF485 family)
MIICCNADVNISDNGKANVRNSLIHILNCCIFCCYIMMSMWWTFSLQPNQTRLWEDDVIGHVCGTGHICESYIYTGTFIYIYIDE